MFDSVAKAVGWIRLALALVPPVVELIKAVELPGNGPAKLAAVVEIVKAAWAFVPADVAQTIGIENVETFVTKVVNVVVALLNSSGVFKSK